MQLQRLERERKEKKGGREKIKNRKPLRELFIYVLYIYIYTMYVCDM